MEGPKAIFVNVGVGRRLWIFFVFRLKDDAAIIHFYVYWFSHFFQWCFGWEVHQILGSHFSLWAANILFAWRLKRNIFDGLRKLFKKRVRFGLDDFWPLGVGDEQRRSCFLFGNELTTFSLDIFLDDSVDQGNIRLNPLKPNLFDNFANLNFVRHLI